MKKIENRACFEIFLNTFASKIIYKPMKKKISTLLVSAMAVSMFVACGPSAEEKAAAEQHMKDSIAAAEKAIADSIIAVQQKAMEDSLAMVKATEDSIANAKAIADSIAAVKSSKPKPKPKTAPKPEVPKVGSKKPGAN
jgi:hypothetical protein